jgi:hypothetical protein
MRTFFTPGVTLPRRSINTLLIDIVKRAAYPFVVGTVVPSSLRRYLKTTKAASTEIAPHAEVYRRFRREWMLLVADARRCSFPWINPGKLLEAVEGATS